MHQSQHQWSTRFVPSAINIRPYSWWRETHDLVCEDVQGWICQICEDFDESCVLPYGAYISRVFKFREFHEFWIIREIYFSENFDGHGSVYEQREHSQIISTKISKKNGNSRKIRPTKYKRQMVVNKALPDNVVHGSLMTKGRKDSDVSLYTANGTTLLVQIEVLSSNAKNATIFKLASGLSNQNRFEKNRDNAVITCTGFHFPVGEGVIEKVDCKWCDKLLQYEAICTPHWEVMKLNRYSFQLLKKPKQK